MESLRESKNWWVYYIKLLHWELALLGGYDPSSKGYRLHYGRFKFGVLDKFGYLFQYVFVSIGLTELLKDIPRSHFWSLHVFQCVVGGGLRETWDHWLLKLETEEKLLKLETEEKRLKQFMNNITAFYDPGSAEEAGRLKRALKKKQHDALEVPACKEEEAEGASVHAAVSSPTRTLVGS